MTAAPSLTLVGLAADLGPLVSEVEAYRQVTQLLCGFADELAPTQQEALEFIELGGGMLGEEVVAADSQGAPVGAVAGVARATCYDDYAQAITGAATLGGLEVLIAPGDGLLAGAMTLVGRLAAHDGNPHPIAPNRSLTLVGDGWLLPPGTNRLWDAPTVVVNRADEPHSALHRVDLPVRPLTGSAQQHVLRRSLPATTAAGDLIAFLNWGPAEGGSVAGDPHDSEPTVLLVDGERLRLLGPRSLS